MCGEVSPISAFANEVVEERLADLFHHFIRKG
jgi:hypothetical protein